MIYEYRDLRNLDERIWEFGIEGIRDLLILGLGNRNKGSNNIGIKGIKSFGIYKC